MGAPERGKGLRVRRLAAAVVISGSFLLASCAQEEEQRMITGGTEEEFFASVEVLTPNLTERMAEALVWAMSDLELADVHARYPNGTPREVIRGEVKDVLDRYPPAIEGLKEQYEKDAGLRNELREIVAQDTSFSIEKNFFGLQPTIKTVVVNGSPHPVSRLKWRAALYLDGASEPVAHTVLDNDYRNQGGLGPGDVFNVSLKVGFVRGDETWSTLEIQNASQRRVVLEPLLDTILDFGERPYLGEDLAPQIERLEAVVEAAKSYSDI